MICRNNPHHPTRAASSEQSIAASPRRAPESPILEPLLTYRQAGDLLGVTERTVWTLVDTGQLQALRFGRSVRIDPADLRAFIERQKDVQSKEI